MTIKSFSYCSLLLIALPVFALAAEKCQITLSASVPRTVTDENTPLDVRGTVSSNDACVGDITVRRTDDAGRTGRVVPPDTPPLVIPSGTSRAFSFPAPSRQVAEIGIDGAVGLRGTYLYPSATVKAADECSASNQVTVYSCSETGASGYHIPESCTLSWFPENKRPLVEKYQKAASVTSAGTKTSPSLPGVPELSHIKEGSISVGYDPEYVRLMKLENKFTPQKPFTLFDELDLSLELKTCQPAPDELPWSVSVLTTDAAGKEQQLAEVVPGLRRKVERALVNDEIVVTRSERDIYAVTIHELAPMNVAELLIESVAANRPLFIRLSHGGEKRDIPLPMTNCARVWGEGEHEIAYMRSVKSTEPAFSLADFIAKANTIRSLGFGDVDPLKGIDPLKKYQNRFAHFLDLKKHITENILREFIAWYAEIFKKSANTFTIQRHNQIFANITASSACQKETHMLLAEGAPRGGVSAVKGRALFVDSQAIDLATHEFGHAFGGLNDEYPYISGPDHTLPIPFRNCSVTPMASWGYSSPKMKGCSYDQVYQGGRATNKETVNVFRSTEDSIMRYGDQFNKVSCGFIMAAINNEALTTKNASKYWPECSRMDTEEPGKIVQEPSLFGRFVNLPQTLSAALPLSFRPWDESESDDTFIIAETLASDGTITGDIYSFSDGEGDDGVRPGVTVDLKINDSDGPLILEKRAPAVISWTSEGAISCKGSWKKANLSDVSGRVRGRITKTHRFTIVCKSDAGPSATDAVEVTIDDEKANELQKLQ